MSAVTPDVRAIYGSSNYKLTPATMAAKISHGHWIPASHLLYVSAHIASAIEKGRGRLIVSLPPRHGKSELLSIYTPIWALDRNIDTRVMLSSYGAELATDFGRRVRDTINMEKDLLDVRLRADSQQVSRFQTTGMGSMYSVGVMGALTGRGANLLLADDYIKNAKDVQSETFRNDMYEWFMAVAMTRLEPHGSVIIIATRWHIDDLIGRLIVEDSIDKGNKWTHIRIPAFAEENDVLGREVGEVLWPERYDMAAMQAIKNSIGTYFWQALYQQDPIPSASGLFLASWLQLVDILPRRQDLRFVRCWDFAASIDAGDYTVGALLCEDAKTNITYICNVIRCQISSSDLEVLVYTTAVNDGRETTIRLEQEPGSAGKMIVDHYARNILLGYIVRADRPTGDKFIRAQPFYAAAENGLIRMVRGPWNRTLTNEFELFPGGVYDDQVDAVSGAFNEMNARHIKGVVWGRDQKSTHRHIGTGELVRGVTFGR